MRARISRLFSAMPSAVSRILSKSDVFSTFDICGGSVPLFHLSICLRDSLCVQSTTLARTLLGFPKKKESVDVFMLSTPAGLGPVTYSVPKVPDKRILRFRPFASTGRNGLPTRRRKMLRTIARLRMASCRAVPRRRTARGRRAGKERRHAIEARRVRHP